jgi:hypothetical protein
VVGSAAGLALGGIMQAVVIEKAWLTFGKGREACRFLAVRLGCGDVAAGWYYIGGRGGGRWSTGGHFYPRFQLAGERRGEVLPSRLLELNMGLTVARLFPTFPAKVAGKFEKILPLIKCLVKQLFQTPFRAKDN